MRALNNILFAAVLGGSCLLWSSAAHADGIVLATLSLAPGDLAKLQAQVSAERAAHPQVFDAVKNLKGHRPENYRNHRNPVPNVTRELRALGASGLMPMLDALALKEPTRGNLTNVEWDALASGMLEVVGEIADAKARPVLLATFETPGLSPRVAAAAARALGRLGGDPELALLTKHAKKGDSLELAAIQGLGWMRRVESATHLSALLSSTKDDAVRAAVASAMGTLGSSWGWKALGPKQAAAGLEVRKILLPGPRIRLRER